MAVSFVQQAIAIEILNSRSAMVSYRGSPSCSPCFERAGVADYPQFVVGVDYLQQATTVLVDYPLAATVVGYLQEATAAVEAVVAAAAIAAVSPWSSGAVLPMRGYYYYHYYSTMHSAFADAPAVARYSRLADVEYSYSHFAAAVAAAGY